MDSFLILEPWGNFTSVLGPFVNVLGLGIGLGFRFGFGNIENLHAWQFELGFGITIVEKIRWFLWYICEIFYLIHVSGVAWGPFPHLYRAPHRKAKLWTECGEFAWFWTTIEKFRWFFFAFSGAELTERQNWCLIYQEISKFSLNLNPP